MTISGVSEPTENGLDDMGEKLMQAHSKAIAFDVDPASLLSLRAALPDWEIEAVQGASAASLTQDWNLGAASLLVLGARDDVTETLDLCRTPWQGPWKSTSMRKPGTFRRSASKPLRAFVSPP